MARSRSKGWPDAPEPLPLPVVDNHTHLESVLAWRADGWEASSSLDAQLERAAAVGVTRMVQVGCDLAAVDWTSTMVGAHEQLLGAVAIHPNEAVRHAGIQEVAADGLDPEDPYETSLDEAFAHVAEVARDNDRIRAVGETGLDHFRAGPAGRAVQREAFRAHIALAKELGLALQIHDRDAHDEVVGVLLADGAPDRTVFHCFSGDAALARLAVSHGWFLSFAGPVSFGPNDALRSALREVPPSQLLLETDAPYLTVHPFRGRPNAPYLLPGTVRTVAEVTGRSVDEVCTSVVATSEAVYGRW
ncbi:TatD family hydrolase [Cellulomonas sp. URHD0024]|uniref:TatD family hydrolase n=1 Tax=Cellulomonas sp. URHD0024 TaxID=1302620 RepID=UPI0003F53C4C|nr:TatD family hydrolase [Cellulomonas sp. URHD0024]